MNVLQVSETDYPGAISGQNLQIHLNVCGIISHQIVATQSGNDANTYGLCDQPHRRAIRESVKDCEKKISLHNLFFPFGRYIMSHPSYLNADIVHCHIIQNHFLPISDMIAMAKQKHLVWTLNDMWALTGCCTYPQSCTQWLSGCVACPQLENEIRTSADYSWLIWRLKKEEYKDMSADIVVASKFMESAFLSSPLTVPFTRVHRIPFGVKHNIFTDQLPRLEIRKKLGISADDFVLFLCATPSEFKGEHHIHAMLNRLKPSMPMTVLTVGEKNRFAMHERRFRVIDRGVVQEERDMADLYAAADVLLMPSEAESFGLMAVEAMMSGIPVVVFDGTALPDVTFAPDCGWVIHDKDISAFAGAVETLMANPEERARRGRLGRKLALQHYRFDDYVRRHVELYEEILNGKQVAP